jgi:hypothetical protein
LPQAAVVAQASRAGLVVEEVVETLDGDAAAGALAATRVFYVTCPSVQAADEVDGKRTPTTSAVGRVVGALQKALVPELQRVSIKSGYLRRGRLVTNKKHNANPTHLGKNGGKEEYRFLWAREAPGGARFVAVLRTVGFDDFRLPMTFHKVVFDDATGAVSTVLRLVEQAA